METLSARLHLWLLAEEPELARREPSALAEVIGALAVNLGMAIGANHVTGSGASIEEAVAEIAAAITVQARTAAEAAVTLDRTAPRRLQ